MNIIDRHKEDAPIFAPDAFRLGDEEVEAPAGGAVMATRGTVHTYWNPRPEPARYVLFMPRRIVSIARRTATGPLDRIDSTSLCVPSRNSSAFSAFSSSANCGDVAHEATHFVCPNPGCA